MLNQAQRQAGAEDADAVGDEVGCVLGDHHSFAQPKIGKARDGCEHLCERVRTRNEFEQMQVSGRIEKMRPQPVAAELFGESRGDLRNG